MALFVAACTAWPLRSEHSLRPSRPVDPPLVRAPEGPVTVPVEGDTSETHDPTIVKEGETYYLFSTNGGIRVRSSRDLVHWQAESDALVPIPAWVQAQKPDLVDLWAPDVSWWNGEWHLYYSASVFATRNSAIGLATSKTLDPRSPEYGWVDHGPVVTSTGTFADRDRSGWNAIDANVVLDRRQTAWLVWGSYFDGLFVQRLGPDGRLDPTDHAVNVARRAFPGPIEGSWITQRGGWWYLFASYDLCCFGTQSTYNIRVGRARSLLGPYVDRAGTPLLSGGGTPVLAGYGQVYGPGHEAVFRDGRNWWLVHHYYDGTRGGRPDLSIRPLDWSLDGWPVARGWSEAIPIPPQR